jgi:hypothetical protein
MVVIAVAVAIVIVFAFIVVFRLLFLSLSYMQCDKTIHFGGLSFEHMKTTYQVDFCPALLRLCATMLLSVVRAVAHGCFRNIRLISPSTPIFRVDCRRLSSSVFDN